MRVTKEFDDSTVAKILELVENASSKKAKVENFITKFARYYTCLLYTSLLIQIIFFHRRAYPPQIKPCRPGMDIHNPDVP